MLQTSESLEVTGTSVRKLDDCFLKYSTTYGASLKSIISGSNEKKSTKYKKTLISC